MAGVEYGTELTASRDDSLSHSGTSSPPSVSFAESGMRQLGVAARSSSPAKRSASERDEDDQASQDGRDADFGPAVSSSRSPKKSNQQHGSPMPGRFKNAIEVSEIQESNSEDMMEADASLDGCEHSETPSSSARRRLATGPDFSPISKLAAAKISSVRGQNEPSASDTIDLPSYDEQMNTIRSLIQDRRIMHAGSKGFIISYNWILRVQSRTSQGLHEGHDKTAREGDVGPVDNSDILEFGNFHGDMKDERGEIFVPIHVEMLFQRDFEVVPEEAWNLIMQWYGLTEDSHRIIRYVRKITDQAASAENLQYELFPPICTIRKLRNEQDSPVSLSIRDPPAVILVASRTESFQGFLARAKLAAGIEMATKVRVWKVLETQKPHDGRSGIPTPVSSRSASPVSQDIPSKTTPRLFIDMSSFSSLEEGTQREQLRIKDETANEKYNGHLELDAIGFPARLTLILEEQIRDSGGEEFISDGSKITISRNGGDTLAAAVNKNGVRASQDSTKLSANTGSARRSPTPSGPITRGRAGKKGRARGCTGLVNLGNTCYMNSALQCIRSVEELSTYFLEGKSQHQINAGNPLGHGGQIAKAYEELVRRIFTGSASFSPQDFRRTLGRCQPLFAGYGQQDSQEFLSFLVDGLHEDLNRVLVKPYMENPESDDNTVHDPDAIKSLGETFRSNHKARNDSVAMDLFNGFYKNTMTCPVCDKISITFDPYSLLTLQLPIAQTFQHVVSFAPLTGLPVYVEVDMDRNSSVKGLKDYVGARVAVAGDRLVMAEMYNGKFYKIFEDAHILAEASIQSGDKLLLCELDEVPTNWPPSEPKKIKNNFSTLSSLSSQDPIPGMDSTLADRMAIPVIHRVSTPRGMNFDLLPSFILVTKEEARDSDKVLRKVLQKINTMTTRDIFDEDQDFQPEEPSSRADSDTVIMEDVETSSSDDPKVQARSVGSEDGLVDISMTDLHTSSRDLRAGKRTHEPHSTKILDPNCYIQPEWRQLFDMKIYSSPGESVPCGWSTLNENTPLRQFESNQTRSSRSSSRRQSNASWTSQAGNQQSVQNSEDEDELSRSNSNHSSVHKGIGSSSPESDSDSKNHYPGHVSDISKSRIKHVYKKPGALTSLKKNKSHKSVANPDTDFVIRLGEGLVLDWSHYGMEQLFEKAHRTFDRMKTFPDPDLELKKEKRAARKKQGIFLEECFEETAKSEILSEDNAWFCGRCKELRRATKKLEIWTVPDILVVHLKRFSTNSRLRDKIDVLVDFPVEDLSLEGKVGLPEGKSLQYDLFAVDNHYGGLGGGHYTAYAQNFFDKKWYDYNDQTVTLTSPGSVVTRAAYLLFYRRRSEKPLGGKYLEDIVRAARASPDSLFLSGEDPRLDDSSSNESSNVFLGDGAEVNHQQGAQHLLGLAGGHQDLENTARDVLSENEPPAYSSADFDEGIGMDDDPDNVLPGIEDQRRDITRIHAPTWDWPDRKEGVSAPPGSSNGNSVAGSDRPEAGDLISERLQEDFDDAFVNNNDNNYIGHISLSNPEHEDDSEVAEIKVSSDTEDGA